MQITKIQYGLTVKDANENYKKAYLEAEIGHGENFAEVKKEIMAEVDKLIGAKSSAAPAKKPVESATKTPAAKTTKAPAKRAPITKKAVETEAPAETEEKKKPAPRRAARATTKKTTPYDRDVKAHKTHLKNLLNERFPDWATPETELNDNAKAASAGLVGVELLGADGNVLDTFIESLDALMVGTDDGL